MEHGSEAVHHALVALRLIQFGAVMAVFGSAAFRFYGVPEQRGTDIGVTVDWLDRWLGRLAITGVLAALVSGVLMVPCIATMMAGSVAAGFAPATLKIVLLETGFGRAWCWHLGLLVLCLVSVARRRRFGPGALLACAALSLASLAFVGHAADERGWLRLVHQANQVLHLLAAGLWLGGLLPLGALLQRARTGMDPGVIAVAREAVPAFSQMGYAAVITIALTGIINTALMVGGLGALFATDYGRLLSLKIALYLTMVALALINRLHLAPSLRWETAPRSATALCRSVMLEQAVGFAILAAVSILGTWAPPH